MLTWFKTEYADWSSTWNELFENAEVPFIPRPIYCMPLNQTWEAQPNVTLLGDAAHVMPPFAGEGANMAMLDAVELSEQLTNGQHHTLQKAVYAYEVNMRSRASVAAEESLENGERMHSEHAIEAMLEIFGGH
jgi:2-polyprenyl-6-methoxyphenol hydroxylase-like FAD-dependent oxidoreductase